MFDAGFLELLVIMIIALLVVGPERLPGLARKAGSLIGKARAFVSNTKADIQRELQAEEMQKLLSQQQNEIQQLREMMENTEQTIRKEITDTEALIKDDGQHKGSETSQNSEKTDAPEQLSTLNVDAKSIQQGSTDADEGKPMTAEQQALAAYQAQKQASSTSDSSTHEHNKRQAST